MFGLGAWEIGLILLVALIFIGPKKLPEVAAQIGRTVRDLQRTANDFTREITNPTDPVAPPPSGETRPDPYRDLAERHKEPPGPGTPAGNVGDDADDHGDTDLDDEDGYDDVGGYAGIAAEEAEAEAAFEAELAAESELAAKPEAPATEALAAKAPPAQAPPAKPTLPTIKPARGAVAHGAVDAPSEIPSDAPSAVATTTPGSVDEKPPRPDANEVEG